MLKNGKDSPLSLVFKPQEVEGNWLAIFSSLTFFCVTTACVRIYTCVCVLTFTKRYREKLQLFFSQMH